MGSFVQCTDCLVEPIRLSWLRACGILVSRPGDRTQRSLYSKADPEPLDHQGKPWQMLSLWQYYKASNYPAILRTAKLSLRKAAAEWDFIPSTRTKIFYSGNCPSLNNIHSPLAAEIHMWIQVPLKFQSTSLLGRPGPLVLRVGLEWCQKKRVRRKRI